VWIAVPDEVVARLESWALIRRQNEPLSSDDQMVGLTVWPYVTEDGVTVEPHDPVELEAYPVLEDALVRAIRDWWKGAPSGSVLNGIPEGFSVNSGTVRALLRKCLSALGEGSWAVPAIGAFGAIPPVTWTDKTGDVTLTFESGALIRVQERTGRQSPRKAPLTLRRERPERVVDIERDAIKADRINIVLDGSHWDRLIRVRIPVAET